MYSFHQVVKWCHTILIPFYLADVPIVLCEINSYNYRVTYSGLSKVIFFTVAEAEGKGGKTLALEVEAEGEAEGLVFCI